MRIALLAVLVLLVAAPSQAQRFPGAQPAPQSPYFAACVASADADPSAPQICACSEVEALKAGATQGNLNALGRLVGPGETLDLEAVPTSLRSTAAVTFEALMTCAFGGLVEDTETAFAEMGTALGDAFSQTGGVQTEPTSTVASRPALAAAPAPATARSRRSAAPGRITQSGKGATIRIRQ